MSSCHLSNGRLERLHRTHREERFLTEDLRDHCQALEAMKRWQQYCNHEPPPGDLRYLRPIDYYRGDPAACLLEREEKLTRALAARRLYWQRYADVEEQQNLSQAQLVKVYHFAMSNALSLSASERKRRKDR